MIANDISSTGWTELPFEVAVNGKPLVGKPSIQQRDYQPSGKYPIVDQGAELIAGFSDNDSAVYSDPLPLILFGDHTRVFKFLDFPFVTGADGTKLLRPNTEVVDSLYLYYAFRALALPSRGYNRHFRLLRDQVVRAPRNKNEQRTIAELLQRLERRIDIEKTISDKLASLKSATMAKLFREGFRGESLRQTEIGEIPQSWDPVRLGNRCKMKSGGTPSREVPEYWGGDIPWVKTAEIDYREVIDTEESITQLGLENSSAKLFDKGTVLMAMYGQGVTRGRVAMLGIPATTNQACAAFFPDETISPNYLYAYFSFAYIEIREMGHGANQRNLSLELLHDVKLPVPSSTDEQEEIFQFVSNIQRQIESSEKKLAALNRLFAATLHSLMTGTIRVGEVDLTEAVHA